MWHLYQFPLCPFSRKVRLLLGEKAVGYQLVHEYPWLKRDEFVDLNPASKTPVMVDQNRKIILADSTAICEFFEETIDNNPLINGTPDNRAEIRRLTAWIDQDFYQNVTQPFLQERVLKRIYPPKPPDSAVLRQAMRAASTHLDYIDYLLDHRNWLAGGTMSLADLAAAAHISVVDYMGGIDWTRCEQIKGWYAGLKSRPSFRPLLLERMEQIRPPEHYEQVDF